MKYCAESLRWKNRKYFVIYCCISVLFLYIDHRRLLPYAGRLRSFEIIRHDVV